MPGLVHAVSTHNFGPLTLSLPFTPSLSTDRGRRASLLRGINSLAHRPEDTAATATVIRYFSGQHLGI